MPATIQTRKTEKSAAATLRAAGLIESGQVLEVRAVKVSTPSYRRRHTESGFYTSDKLDPACEAAVRLEQSAAGIYFTLNPIKPDLLARRCNRVDVAEEGELATDRDVVRRRLLLIDADPVRPDGISATDDEKATALATVTEVREFLHERGFPAPVLCDSGNGYHVLLHVDLPNDDDSRDLVRNVLLSLAQRFDSPAVKIDRKVFNAARITKFYGTMSRKGDSTHDRPHRRSAVIDVPHEIKVAPRELLEALAAEVRVETPKPATNGKQRHPFHVTNGVAGRAAKYVAKMAPAISGNGGHDTTFNVAQTLVKGFNLPEAEAWPILLDYNGRCQPPWSERDLRHKLDSARTQSRLPVGYLLNGDHRPADDHAGDRAIGIERDASHETTAQTIATPDETGASRLPLRIDATEENLADLTEQAFRAIKASNTPPTMFRYGSVPSRIERDDDGAPMLRPMTVDRMRHRLARDAHFLKLNEKDEECAIAPPLSVVRDVLATPDPDLPVLSRVVEAPAFAPDGSLCREPGYNPVGKTYYVPAAGFEIPELSPQPAAEELEQARDLITLDLLGDFPFVSESEKAHAVAAAIGPFVRNLIDGPTPLHSFEAPSPGTGKTLLVELLTIPALGRPVSAMTEGRDEDEWRKRLFAKLRSAPSVLLLDNIKRRLESGALASAITAYPLWEDRLLGVSEIVRVPVRCIWLVTGNNPALSSEMTRRTVRIRLDAQVDRPWLREGFRHQDIRGWAVANRGRLVWALLTLIQAWIAAGRPEGRRTLGMFERWAKVIGGILDVAAVPGFLGNLEDFYERSDADGESWRTFVAHWWTSHGDAAVAVTSLWSLATDAGLELGDKSEQSQRIRLGKQLANVRDRTFTVTVSDRQHQLRVEQDGTDHRAKLWRLVPRGAESGECGECR
jgi:hypothetical protein